MNISGRATGIRIQNRNMAFLVTKEKWKLDIDTTLHYTIQHYTTLHYTTLYYTTLHYTILHYTTLHYTILHYTILHYTTLHYTVLHYTTLHYTPRHDTLHKLRLDEISLGHRSRRVLVYILHTEYIRLGACT